MTRRQLRRRARRHPILAAVLVLLGLVLVLAVLRDAPGLVILGAIAAPVAWYAERQARRPVARTATRPLPTPYSAPPPWLSPPPPRPPGMVPAIERDRLASDLAGARAELAAAHAAARDMLAVHNREMAALRAELTGARASATAAWDQAASRPPVHQEPRDVDRRTTILADARSGARPLIPS